MGRSRRSELFSKARTYFLSGMFLLGAGILLCAGKAEAVNVKEDPNVHTMHFEDAQDRSVRDIGLILDASGSMAFTAEQPSVIKVSGDFPKYTFLTLEQTGQILDRTKTDQSKLGYDGYRYYVAYRSGENDYAPLTYWDGTNGKTVLVKDTEYQTAADAEGNLLGVLLNADAGENGWYYINSGDAGFFQNEDLSTAKQYVGLPENASNDEETPMNFQDPAIMQQWGSDETEGGCRPVRFFVDNDNCLKCFICRHGTDSPRLSYVYERQEGQVIREDVMKAFIASLCEKGGQGPVETRYSVVRFSHKDFYPQELVVCDWTDDEDQVKRSLEQNYGLTASTSTRTGFNTYLVRLHPEVQADEDKLLILVSDGADTDNLGQDPDEYGYNALDYAETLKNIYGYKIAAFYIKNSPEGDEKAETLMKQFASAGEDGAPLYWSLYGSDPGQINAIAEAVMNISR